MVNFSFIPLRLDAKLYFCEKFKFRTFAKNKIKNYFVKKYKIIIFKKTSLVKHDSKYDKIIIIYEFVNSK